VLLQQYHYFLNEMDFFAVNVLLPVGALIEVLIFVFILGIKNGWEGVTAGARIRVPRLFRFILHYVTPAYLIILLGWWTWEHAIPRLTLSELAGAVRHTSTGVRVLSAYGMTAIASHVILGVVLLGMLLLLEYTWRYQREEKNAIPGVSGEEEHPNVF
jgi:hypothetical protein